MTDEISPHDAERDRIASEWSRLPPFQCEACKEERACPAVASVQTEARFDGPLRADVAAFDAAGNIVGVVEVVRSNPPSAQVLASQERFGFAFYRRLPYANVNNEDAWLCSTECWTWYLDLRGREPSTPWDAPRCDGCETYFHQNPLTWYQFRDWSDDPHYAYCIHCAAGRPRSQWRSPGKLAGGDPRDWTPDDGPDPAARFLAYCDAPFWSLVWTSRVAKLDDPDGRRWAESEATKDATARRLVLVNEEFDSEEWERGTNLLLLVAAPGWAYYPGEDERMLAFRPENCRGISEAWERLLRYRREQLPEDLLLIIERRP